MDLEFTKTDDKVIKIFTNLYLRGYSFADVYDILTGESLHSILARRIYENIEETKEYIKLDITLTKKDYEEVLDDANIDKLLSTITTIIDMLNNINAPIAKKIVVELENDIKEIKLINSSSYKKINIPPNIKTECTLYKMLQNTDYNELKESRLTQELLEKRNENNI